MLNETEIDLDECRQFLAQKTKIKHFPSMGKVISVSDIAKALGISEPSAQRLIESQILSPEPTKKEVIKLITSNYLYKKPLLDPIKHTSKPKQNPQVSPKKDTQINLFQGE